MPPKTCHYDLSLTNTPIYTITKERLCPGLENIRFRVARSFNIV